MDLATLWFLGLGVLLTVYAVLDGFDLGVGTLHLFVRGDMERRLTLNSIGPLWDGNEVWLVTFGGALFAAFPEAYATILSGFYLPFIALVLCLVGRAVSIELRSKHHSRWWRGYWDFSFFASSTLVTFLFGLLAGNLILGVPLDAQSEYAGTLGTLFRPYPLAVGAFAVITSAMHGALFLRTKTEGELEARVARWSWTAFGVFLVAWVGVTIATLVLAPHATRNFERWPAAWIVVVLCVLAVANVPRALFRGRPAEAFLSSCGVVASHCFLFGMAMFPNLLYATPGADGSMRAMDVWEARSSEATLALMTWIAVLGLPLIATYTIIVYRVFAGKVKLSKYSY